MTFAFTIIGKLPGLNDIINEGRTDKQFAASQKKKWTQMVAWHAKAQSVPVITKPVFLRILWVEPNKRRDPDNVAAGVKFILDGLQMVGILKNDGWANILAISHRFAVDKKNPRIVVEMHEVEHE